MGLFDKAKEMAGSAVGAAGDMAMRKADEAKQSQMAKAERKELDRQAKSSSKALQEEYRKAFRVTNDMGDVSIDSANMLFKVRRASADIPKQSGAMMKAFKATAAISTMGASVALEHAMKPSDRIFRFDEIRSFELLEDDSQVVGGGVGMALVGGAFFGAAGAIAGSVAGKKKTKKTCDSMLLRIDLNDFDMPCVIIPYIKKTVKKTSNEYRKALSEAQQTISCLQMIVDALDGAKPVEPQRVVVEHIGGEAQADDSIDKVKKLKDLLDMGVLTQEEFDAKKRELLGL